ncbi:MAG: 2-oxoglutarate ferredoxin oxidoreductase subunit alpha, partial [Planctomycetaceae bacterium]|nr:2-oxoglutarate ferredoxin oxidoreductase subunit alpha [Planctomycetaceae bacterium]
EIAAITSVVGAAFGGALAVTASSGPGIALKSEGIGLGVITELPMVIVNVQRGGPSTGLPTKTEQSDLLLSLFGRNGESPLPVLAAATPADCFEMAQEAMRIAVEHMTPCILLTDGYIANGSEPWRIPALSELTPIRVKHPTGDDLNGDAYKPYLRDEQLVRPWAVPGTPGLEHRVGGLEKSDITGNVDYSPTNHHHMTLTRQKKIDLIADRIPQQDVFGDASGKLLVVSWGGTFGATRTAVQRMREAGKSVSHAHIRYMNPFPKNLGDVVKSFDRVLIPELNLGQLRLLIRAHFLVDAVGLNKVQGKPFKVAELTAKMEELLG